MKNPPNFVMYVVMVKLPKCEVFDPSWGYWTCSIGPRVGLHAMGFAQKRDADRECKALRTQYGKKNVYVQQYGPYK